MKWSTLELRKHHRTDNDFSYVFDCHPYIGEDEEDLVDVTPVKVTGIFTWVEAEDRYIFNIDVSCVLTMLCAITLDEVEIPLDFHTVLQFSETVKDDYTMPIEGATLDLDPFVWGEIMVEKPMRALSENAYRDYREEIKELDEEEKLAKSPFAKLRKKPTGPGR